LLFLFVLGIKKRPLFSFTLFILLDQVPSWTRMSNRREALFLPEETAPCFLHRGVIRLQEIQKVLYEKVVLKMTAKLKCQFSED
jgi:hypothetical protein